MSFTNGQVAHLWANQSRPSARSSNGNFHFSGRVITSYSTPIASLEESPITGETVALIDSSFYSKTTSGKHLPAINRALGYGDSKVVAAVFHVPCVALWGSPERDAADHDTNARHLLEVVRGLVDKAKRRRVIDPADVPVKPGSWESNSLEEATTAAWDYTNTFPVSEEIGREIAALLDHDLRIEIEQHRAIRLAKYTHPATVAKREHERATREQRREEREAAEREKRRVAQLENLRRFRSGEWFSPSHDLNDGEIAAGALLRVVRNPGARDLLETSWGARVPLDHAMRAFPFIAKCREVGKIWRASDRSIRVGDFSISEIDHLGNFRAGCHWINWGEVAQVARSVGLLEVDPATVPGSED